MINFIRKNPILVMFVLFVVTEIGIRFNLGDSVWGKIPCRFVLGVIMLGTLYIVAGKEIFTWTKKSGRYAFLRSSYLLGLPFVLFAIQLILDSVKGFKDNGIAVVISYLLLSLCIGFFEEGIYRGIMVNGLVKVFPKTRAGLWQAVVISGLIFGFIHVWTYIFAIGTNPVSVIVQMAGKTFVTGIFGLLLAVIYLKTKNIWVCMIVHALNDFLAFLALIGLGMDDIKIQYVDTALTMNPEIFFSQVFPQLLTSIPNLIIALIILKKLKPSECVIWK